ncbi:hypothetical protein [Rubripirellula amarantea]|nr:hypothetical protein [Rubripirellula amarantea]
MSRFSSSTYVRTFLLDVDLSVPAIKMARASLPHPSPENPDRIGI